MSVGLPVISVILPSYNHGPFLAQRIDSILNQSFQDFELIILDDCSTDNSRNVIARYADHPKVAAVIYNEKNSGSTFPQWSRGISAAKCEWIWIAESDDVADLGFLQHLYGLATVNPRASLVYCRTRQIDDNGKDLGLNLWADGLDNTRWNKSYEVAGREDVENYLLFRCIMPNASAVIFKKRNALDILAKIMAAKMRFCGDWFFWGHILNDGYVLYSPKELNFQRSHTETTREMKSKAGEITRIKECIYCIEEISGSIGRKVNWSDKRYSWLYEYCKTRVPFNKKFQTVFFNIAAQKKFIINAIVFDIKVFVSSIPFKFKKSITGFFN